MLKQTANLPVHIFGEFDLDDFVLYWFRSFEHRGHFNHQDRRVVFIFSASDLLKRAFNNCIKRQKQTVKSR